MNVCVLVFGILRVHISDEDYQIAWVLLGVGDTPPHWAALPPIR